MSQSLHRVPLLATALLLSPLLATAADGVTASGSAAKAPSAQHARMASCNKDARDKALKGEARRKFMSECLSAGKSGKAARAPKTTA